MKEFPFLFLALAFLVEPTPQPLFPALCKPKTSGSAYFGKLRGDETRRLSHSVKAYPQFRSSYPHEEMVEHFLLTPAELQLVLT
jgi:hypothetical protein